MDHVLDRNCPDKDGDNCFPCSYSPRPAMDGSCCTGCQSPGCMQTSFFPELRDRYLNNTTFCDIFCSIARLCLLFLKILINDFFV